MKAHIQNSNSCQTIIDLLGLGNNRDNVVHSLMCINMKVQWRSQTKNIEGVKGHNFPAGGVKSTVYTDIFITFVIYNFSQIFTSGGAFTPSYTPMAPPLGKHPICEIWKMFSGRQNFKILFHVLFWVQCCLNVSLRCFVWKLELRDIKKQVYIGFDWSFLI